MLNRNKEDRKHEIRMTLPKPTRKPVNRGHAVQMSKHVETLSKCVGSFQFLQCVHSPVFAFRLGIPSNFERKPSSLSRLCHTDSIKFEYRELHEHSITFFGHSRANKSLHLFQFPFALDRPQTSTTRYGLQVVISETTFVQTIDESDSFLLTAVAEKKPSNFQPQHGISLCQVSALPDMNADFVR